MDIVIDFGFIVDFLSLPPDKMLKLLFLYLGWIPIAVVLLWGILQVWLNYIKGKWAEKNAKFTLLAVDIPRGNEQSPKAVENLFSYLAGAHGSINLIEKYWEGKSQLNFSFEIVSIGGYTQFMIYTPVGFRNLVESAVYSQYPDAEITEIEDYTQDWAELRFPDDKYDIWGAEFIQAKHFSLPIKTYENFEHQMGAPETHFKDPMASLMDLMSSLQQGEQLWYQIVVIPTGFDWIDECDKEVSKMLGEKTGNGGNIFTKFADGVFSLLKEVFSSLFGGESASESTQDSDPLKMMNLKPKQKKKVEGIENKTSHFAFEFKIRMVYLADKEVMQKAKVVNGFVGYMKQFAALDMNNLKPDMSYTATSTAYLFARKRLIERKNRIFKNYINRTGWGGRKPGVLNVEELATIWHFPQEAVVKAPLIQKAPGRKAEPPMSLPQSENLVSEEPSEPLFLEEEGGLEKKDGAVSDKEGRKKEKQDRENEDDPFSEEEEREQAGPPSNLPIG